jgi:hypothetical protein
MADVTDRDDFVRAFIEVGPGMKGKIERAVDALLDILDGLSGDSDVEDNGDDELTGDEEEPTLGGLGSAYSLERPQTEWAGGRWDQPITSENDDCEKEDEHGGDILDEGEPMLGSTTCANQEHAWSPGNRWAGHDTCESEPSLGWTGIGRGHPETAMRGSDQDREEEHHG